MSQTLFLSNTFFKGSKYKSSIVTKRDGRSDVNANKRNPAVAAGAKALVSNPKVQEAAVEKGIEIAGKLVDKKLKIIEDAQKKASDFLKEKVTLFSLHYNSLRYFSPSNLSRYITHNHSTSAVRSTGKKSVLLNVLILRSLVEKWNILIEITLV